jgi:subtilisin family serine protease
MRTTFATLTAVALIFLLVVATTQAEPTRMIVVFSPAVNEPTREAIIKAVGGVIIKNLPLIDGKAVLLLPQAEAVLGRIPGVVRVDPDVIIEALGETLPWGVNRIDADLAWGVSTGSGVKVAIVDTGIQLTHPDLQANIKGNVNTINPKKTGDDDNGHGTHVAGTVAAIDNDIGVIGASPTAYLYAVKVLSRTGSGFLSDVIEGLQWCIDNGMQVANMSLGTSSYSQSFEEAVKKVNEAGIVQVAAAGNSGPADNTVAYPAKFAEVIAVSATDKADTIASWSSRGPEVELAAPGVDIYSTYKGSTYKTLSGTSMAAPHVTGTVALAIAAGVADVRGTLQATADDLGATGKDDLYGYGLVDAEEATTGTQTQPAPRLRVCSTDKLATTWAKIKK